MKDIVVTLAMIAGLVLLAGIMFTVLFPIILFVIKAIAVLATIGVVIYYFTPH